MQGFVEDQVAQGLPIFHLGPDWGDVCGKAKAADGRAVLSGGDFFLRWTMPQDGLFFCTNSPNLAFATELAAFKIKVHTCDKVSSETCNRAASGSNECMYTQDGTPMRRVWCRCGHKYTGPQCDQEIHLMWFFPLVSTCILLYFGMFLAVAAVRPMRMYRVSLEDVGGTEEDRTPLFQLLSKESNVRPFRPGMGGHSDSSESSSDEASTAPQQPPLTVPKPTTPKAVAKMPKVAPKATKAVDLSDLTQKQSNLHSERSTQDTQAVSVPVKVPIASKAFTLSKAQTYDIVEDVDFDQIKKPEP